MSMSNVWSSTISFLLGQDELVTVCMHINHLISPKNVGLRFRKVTQNVKQKARISISVVFIGKHCFT